MSQYRTDHSIIFSIILASLAVALTLAGCRDDILYEPVEISDAEVEIQGEVIFRPLVPTEVQTRAEAEAPEGAAYKGIKDLYVFFYDSEKNIVKDYCGKVDFTPVPSEGSTHEHVKFKKKVRAGKYYVYAVANISVVEAAAIMKLPNVEALRNYKLVWNDNIEKDLEMFGVFGPASSESPAVPDNEDFEEDNLLTITPNRSRIYSWVRRAVSKVTVDFDGTNLKEGVTVYIRKATLKDVASGAALGTSSYAEGVAEGDVDAGDDRIVCVPSNYTLTYGTGDDYSNWPSVTRDGSFTPTIWGEPADATFHDDDAKALPCYENRQVVEGKSKLQDSDGDGIIDSFDKDDVANGTYLEVEGYYVANRPEYKSHGKIIYRFMLGNNATDNFELIRNHHYKITMNFKGYGNDVDWHIVYTEQYLDVTYPQDVNYQGKFFKPSLDYSATMANAGHEFDNQNVITVTSFETDGKSNTWIDPEITYTDMAYDADTDSWVSNSSTTLPKWLKLTEGEVNANSQKEYTYVASEGECTESTVNALFLPDEKGGKTNPYNLSNSSGGSAVQNTANCYMVGAPGWYCFPLVYGNAISGGNDNPNAYTLAYSNIKNENDVSQDVPQIVNHLNKAITQPYIKDNDGINLSNVSVKLIWQDVENLVTASKIEYDPALFGGMGGIKFHIPSISEGNAVIALIDNSASEDEWVNIDRGAPYNESGSTKAIWSWHIWCTPFGSGVFEETIQVRNHDDKPFDVMPVNLGWCSGGRAIKYYERRKCEITFKVGDREITRTIEQYPHFLLPRGDHPYYQWGRKDPFVGSNALWKNKQRWDHDGVLYDVWGQYNPPRLYNEPQKFSNNINRKNTIHCLNVLVKNPDKWHNAKRRLANPAEFEKDPDNYTGGYESINESFPDLWSNNGKKTVYDPCPVGYQVSDNTIFTGFTTHGKSAKFPYDWYDVLESNMEESYYSGSSINRQVLELYTDTRKLQSITFPVSGYRDYDGKAQVVQYPNVGDPDVKGEGYVWFNNAKDETNSFHLKFHRNDIQGNDWKGRGGEGLNLIAPYEAFYNTDGFGVRPVREVTKTN